MNPEVFISEIKALYIENCVEIVIGLYATKKNGVYLKNYKMFPNKNYISDNYSKLLGRSPPANIL